MELRIGDFVPAAPVVLAPMAGVTNAPFRALCRRFGPDLVYVNEMVMATALVHGNAKTARMMAFGPDEHPRSLQVYGSDPVMMGRAVDRVCGAGLVDHIDLNFGCPAAKVTRKGGGAAVPAKPALLRAIVRRRRAPRRRPYGVPVTAKFRIGLHDGLLDPPAGRARSAPTRVSWRSPCTPARSSSTTPATPAGTPSASSRRTSRRSRCSATATSGRPTDAVRMMRHTGCDGVVVGRGCLGRPWLFGDLVAVLSGRPAPPSRPLGVALGGDGRPRPGARRPPRRRTAASALAMRTFRKHASWYLTGYPVGSEARRRFAQVSTLAELDDLAAALDPALTVVPAASGSGAATPTARSRSPCPTASSTTAARLEHDVAVPDDDDVMALSGG